MSELWKPIDLDSYDEEVLADLEFTSREALSERIMLDMIAESEQVFGSPKNNTTKRTHINSRYR